MAQGFTRNGSSVITLTGDSGGPLSGSGFTITGASTGLTFAGSGTTETLGGTLVVANGGTGVASTTAYAPICGGTTTTGAFQAASTGLSTSGYVLTSNGSSALPSFQAPAAGGVAFAAYLVTGVSNVTGDGTAYTIIFDTVQQQTGGTNYSTSTGLFTVPSTGFYLFTANFIISNVGAGHTALQADIITGTGIVFNMAICSPGPIRGGAGVSNLVGFAGSYIAYLTASATVYCAAVVANSTKTVGIFGSSNCTFSGVKLS